MTDEEKASMLAVMVESDTSTDASELNAYLKLAGKKILNLCYPFGYADDAEVPRRYDVLQCEIAAHMWNRRGAMGETAHSENGVSRVYDDGDIPSSLLCQITPQGVVY